MDFIWTHYFEQSLTNSQRKFCINLYFKFKGALNSNKDYFEHLWETEDCNLNLLGPMRWLSGCWCLLPRLMTRVPVLITTYWKERTKSHCSPSDLHMHPMAYTWPYTNTSTQWKRHKFIYFWYYLTCPTKKKKDRLEILQKNILKVHSYF